MTLGSCKAKKEDKVGADPQKMAVNLSLTEPCTFFFSYWSVVVTVVTVVIHVCHM